MKRRLQHLTEFARHFLRLEAAGGVVMIGCAALAVLVANSPFSAQYTALISLPLGGHFTLSSFTKDVLMAIFFFAVGMELKAEMREGTLSQPGQKLLPLVAALGGIVVPSLLYLAITHHHPEVRDGWAIPTATDIAFALCILRLAGPAIPQPAKMFLLAIAIYDDLAAILIIAFFYASGVALLPLLASLSIAGVLLLLNHRHVTHIPLYLLLGVGLWTTVHAAGIHPTVAGLVTGLVIPMRTASGQPLLAYALHRVHPYVAFLILPLFAFTSAGIDLRALSLADAFAALPLAVALGLFVGKQLGIFAATFVCVKTGLSALPTGVNWRMVYAVAIIAGIGFTMSLFIGQLAFNNPQQLHAVTGGVIAGSALSSAFGLLYLRLLKPKNSLLSN